jgi:hypothetical protein
MGKWDEESSQEKLITIAANIDNFLVKQSLDYELSMDAVNGIFMARLLRMNMEVGNKSNLFKLLQAVLQDDLPFETQDESVH